MTIEYYSEKHRGLEVLLERPVCATKACLFTCLREMNKTFSNGNMQIQDFNLAVGKGLY